jgi:hypothetical protein
LSKAALMQWPNRSDGLGKDPMPWVLFGLIIAACSFLGAFLILALTTLPSLKAWVGVLPCYRPIGPISTTNA